ncbi:Omega-amidase chloroplastic [Zea mays]|uniref:Omega-amidase chloroplastic n=1 Tax=Zea mays TaxID=4577 RepID=A0A1D6PJ22_MAIZE|nr:Omega-amidase chloroplastic [Zea mays]
MVAAAAAAAAATATATATATAAALLAPGLKLCAGRARVSSPSGLPPRRVTAMASAPNSSFRPEEARYPPALELPIPRLSKFKVALCQLSVTADKSRNIAHARAAIEKAASDGAKLVVLPEIWNGPYSNDSFPEYAEDIEAGGDAAPSFSMLSEVARSLQITLVGGSIAERSGNNLYNTCCVFGSDGQLKGKHRKIHLFDIDIPGKITFKESKTLTAGQSPTVVDTDVGRIGIGICYDIRFQELAMLYAARGAVVCAVFGPCHLLTHSICKMDRHFSDYFLCSFVVLSWCIQHDYWTTALGVAAKGEVINEFEPQGCRQSVKMLINCLLPAVCCNMRSSSRYQCRLCCLGTLHSCWTYLGIFKINGFAVVLKTVFGEVIATTEHEEATIIADIDYSLIEQRRQFLPVQHQRRGDLYQLVDVQRLGSQ